MPSEQCKFPGHTKADFGQPVKVMGDMREHELGSFYRASDGQRLVESEEGNQDKITGRPSATFARANVQKVGQAVDVGSWVISTMTGAGNRTGDAGADAVRNGSFLSTPKGRKKTHGILLLHTLHPP
jgi:hypothetical protein